MVVTQVMNAPRSIDDYLKQLRAALGSDDPALIHGANDDTRGYISDYKRPAADIYRVNTTTHELDVRGGGAEVGTWATAHGFRLPPDAPHPQNALLFLNYMMRPEIIAKVQLIDKWYVQRLAAFVPLVENVAALFDGLGYGRLHRVAVVRERVAQPGADARLAGAAGILLEAARRAWNDLGRAPADLRYETFGSSGRTHWPAFIAGAVVFLAILAVRTLFDAVALEGMSGFGSGVEDGDHAGKYTGRLLIAQRW